MSRKCQNRLSVITRVPLAGVRPFLTIWTPRTAIHRRPTVTCRPWVLTSVKKAERKALCPGPSPGGYEAGEFAHLQDNERRAEHEGDTQPSDHPVALAAVHGQRSKAVGKAAEEQTEGPDQHTRQLEKLLTGRTAGIAPAENGIRCEEARKEYAVAHDIDPEAEDPVRRGLRTLVEMGMDAFVAHEIFSMLFPPPASFRARCSSIFLTSSAGRR